MTIRVGPVFPAVLGVETDRYSELAAWLKDPVRRRMFCLTRTFYPLLRQAADYIELGRHIEARLPRSGVKLRRE